MRVLLLSLLPLPPSSDISKTESGHVKRVQQTSLFTIQDELILIYMCSYHGNQRHVCTCNFLCLLLRIIGSVDENDIVENLLTK